MNIMLTTLVLSSVLAAASAAQAAQATNQQAEQLYASRCAMCHEGGVPRAANRQALGKLSVDLIRQALTTGAMRSQANGLSPTEIDSVARLLGTNTPTTASTAGACTASATFTDPLGRPRWNGWGVTSAQHRFQPRPLDRRAVDTLDLQLVDSGREPGQRLEVRGLNIAGGE